MNPREISPKVFMYPVAAYRAHADFNALVADGVVRTSRDVNYGDAIFGRDSLEFAEDLLDIRPEVARLVIVNLARLQGNAWNDASEEEPGKIPHEHRTMYINNRLIQPSSQEILRKLGPRWGGSETEMTYYGSLDATPLHVRLIGELCMKHGDAVLGMPFVDKDGNHRTVFESFLQGLHWILNSIEASDIGLIEYQRRNPLGIANQVWTDSGSAFVHPNGDQVNHDAPIAPIEVQAYAYDALALGAKVLARVGAQHELRLDLQGAAAALQQRVVASFWSEEAHRLVAALDRDPQDGSVRKMVTPSANTMLPFATSLFDSLPAADKEHLFYTQAEHIYSDEFLTNAGVRCRGLSAAGVVDFDDYHGSKVSWIKQTHDVMNAFARWGADKVARELRTRILNTAAIAGNKEYVFVDTDGYVAYHAVPINELRKRNVKRIFVSTNVPEAGQAWSASAVRSNLFRRGRSAEPSRWIREFDKRLVDTHRRATPLSTLRSLAIVKSSAGVDLDLGRERDRRWNPGWAAVQDETDVAKPTHL